MKLIELKAVVLKPWSNGTRNHFPSADKDKPNVIPVSVGYDQGDKPLPEFAVSDTHFNELVGMGVLQEVPADAPAAAPADKAQATKK